MSHMARQTLAIHGRRFEIVMLNFEIEKCHCCGVVTPRHNDLLVGNNASGYAEHPFSFKPLRFRRHHLRDSYYSATLCSCAGPLCQGRGYWAGSNNGTRELNQLFLLTHGYLDELGMLRDPTGPDSAHKALEGQVASNGNLSLVTVCQKCKPDHVKIEKGIAPAFSFRNGFGPHVDVEVIPNFNSSILYRRKAELIVVLNRVLTTLTIAEEAAIRQVTPLISIASLKNGNIANKGNISCVNQQCKWQSVLPNLSEEF